MAASAYRAADRLVKVVIDKETGQKVEVVHDYSGKRKVFHAEIMLPSGAPAWMIDRQKLWQHVEDREELFNSQLAREVVVAIPIELDFEQGKRLVSEYVAEQFVAKGMVADIAIHWAKGNPHAHIMLSTRRIEKDGFGTKRREWNSRSFLAESRSVWTSIVNKHLAMHGINARIDHRSFKEIGVDLKSEKHLGHAANAIEKRSGNSFKAQRNREIREVNKERIIADPEMIVKLLGARLATFSEEDLKKELVKRLYGDVEQVELILSKLMASDKIVELQEKGFDGAKRYAYDEYYVTEEKLQKTISEIVDFKGDAPNQKRVGKLVSKFKGTDEQKEALRYLLGGGNLKVLSGIAGSGKTRIIKEVVAYYEGKGAKMFGATISGVAADVLTKSAGIEAKTIASLKAGFEFSKRADKENKKHQRLNKGDFLIIDEAGMVDVTSMQYLLNEAKNVGAKVIVLGDTEQVSAISAGDAFRVVLEKVGGIKLSSGQRQELEWQSEASSLMFKGKTSEAIAEYDSYNRIFLSEDKQSSLQNLVQAYLADNSNSKIILAHSNKDCLEINRITRKIRLERGEIFNECYIQTDHGKMHFASGDKIVFLKNEYASLDVKNGTTGVIKKIEGDSLEVMVDDQNKDGRPHRRIKFSSKDYNSFTHGYAMTVHKVQGVTVDKSYVFGSGTMDSRLLYVAMTRHKKDVQLYLDKSEFKDIEEFKAKVSRTNQKDLVNDYEDGGKKKQIMEAIVKYKDSVREAKKIFDKLMAESVAQNITIYEHEAWKKFVEAKAVRADSAARILNLLPANSVRSYLKLARVSRDMLEYHAGIKKWFGAKPENYVINKFKEYLEVKDDDVKYALAFELANYKTELGLILQQNNNLAGLEKIQAEALKFKSEVEMRHKKNGLHDLNLTERFVLDNVDVLNAIRMDVINLHTMKQIALEKMESAGSKLNKLEFVTRKLSDEKDNITCYLSNTYKYPAKVIELYDELKKEGDIGSNIEKLNKVGLLKGKQFLWIADAKRKRANELKDETMQKLERLKEITAELHGLEKSFEKNKHKNVIDNSSAVISAIDSELGMFHNKERSFKLIESRLDQVMKGGYEFSATKASHDMLLRYNELTKSIEVKTSEHIMARSESDKLEFRMKYLENKLFVDLASNLRKESYKDVRVLLSIKEYDQAKILIDDAKNYSKNDSLARDMMRSSFNKYLGIIEEVGRNANRIKVINKILEYDKKAKERIEADVNFTAIKRYLDNKGQNIVMRKQKELDLGL